MLFYSFLILTSPKKIQLVSNSFEYNGKVVGLGSFNTHYVFYY